jgi:hypothetical protein
LFYNQIFDYSKFEKNNETIPTGSPKVGIFFFEVKFQIQKKADKKNGQSVSHIAH